MENKKQIYIWVVVVLVLVGAIVVFAWDRVPKDDDLQIKNTSETVVRSDAKKYYEPDWSKLSGALVKVSMDSKVGVLLDEIPLEEREDFVENLLDQPESFWQDRAERQVLLTSLRLSFRNAFYPKGTKWQLPLPPEELWKIKLEAPKREKINGHDLVTASYSFSGMLLSDSESPGISEPALKEIGGTWEEPFIFPVDPELVLQRTGYACMDEAQFPPNSVDAEEVDLFYDQDCKVESKLSNNGCHQTKMPTQSCVQALKAEIGSIETVMKFERLAWDAKLAESVRLGDITNPDGPDLQPDREEFMRNRFTYRYIPSNSCTLVEQCVGGSGWRKLLMFPTADLNVGAKALDIGTVDYFQKTDGSDLSKHGVFEFSACHEHYHFSHYGSFTLGDGSETITRKNGFCMQPTARLSNHELSPLHHPYVDCIDQGVAVGWIDEYKMGLECQWLDVTEVEPKRELPLAFTTNPDAILCEGKLKLDDKGKQIFEPTEFKTSAGQPVDKAQCDFYPEFAQNNTESYDVYIPEIGESYVTEDCRDGLFGPLRNCGFEQEGEIFDCKPGSKVNISCEVSSGSAVQVIRFCEASRVLGVGIPCTYNESLVSDSIQAQKNFTFKCPIARDEVETGGSYSFMTGALFPNENDAKVTCTVLP